MTHACNNLLVMSPTSNHRTSGNAFVAFKGKIPLEAAYEAGAQKLLRRQNPLSSAINNLLYKPLQHFENDGRELGAIPLFLFAIVYMVGNRYLRARNSDERREVLTRDSTTGFTAFFLIYAIRRYIAKIMQNKIGVPGTVKTVDGKVKLADWFSRKSGGLYLKSYEEIGETYSAKNARQLYHYKKYIPLGLGDKFLAFLPDNAQKALQELTEKYKFFHNRTNVDNLVKKVPAVQQNLNIVLHAIDKVIVPKAKIAKVVPDTISTLFTVGLLGFVIPRFNIVHTRNLYQQKPNNSVTAPSATTNLLQRISLQQSGLSVLKQTGKASVQASLSGT